MGGSLPYTYSWTPADSLNNASIFDPIATPSVTTNYQVFVTDANGLQIKGSVFVPVTLTLTTSATPQVIQRGAKSLLAATVLGGVPSYSYLWTPSAGLSAINIASPTAGPAATTIYSVTVTDSAGATIQGAVKVGVGTSAPPVVSFTLTWLDKINLLVDASGSTSGVPIVRYEYTQAWFGDPNQPYDVCYYPAGFPSINCVQASNPAQYTFAGNAGETVRVRIVDLSALSADVTRVAPAPPP
jgi:hypothetical protein